MTVFCYCYASMAALPVCKTNNSVYIETAIAIIVQEVIPMRKTWIFLCVLAVLSPLARAVSASPEITAAPGQVDPYRTRSELLMDAARYTGVCTPEQAADVWAKGLEQRNAAMQYAVMTDVLKVEYVKQLDALRSNWVTGVSSPWVSDFTIEEVSRSDGTHAKIGLRVETMTSHSPPEVYHADLRLIREDGFWRIEEIRADQELYAYTLYRP